MAANLSCKQQAQKVDDLISCAICLDHFDDPRILPCSHTFCLRCIHQTASSNQGQFVCPMRDGTRIGRDCIDSLPVNRHVREMVEILPIVMDKNDRNRATCERVFRFSFSFASVEPRFRTFLAFGCRKLLFRNNDGFFIFSVNKTFRLYSRIIYFYFSFSSVL